MAYNVLSFTNQNDAQTFVNKNGGNLLTFGDLKQFSWQRNQEMVKEMKAMKEKMQNMKKDNGMNNMNKTN